MNIGSDANIGLVVYNSWSQKLMSLSGPGSKEELKNKILAMYAQGGTATYSGINEAATSLVSETTDSDVRKIMIVLTDGISSYPDMTRSAYINAANQGIEILTVLYNMGGGYYNVPGVLDWYQNYINSSIGAGQVISADSGNIIDFFSNDALRYVRGEDIGTEVTSQTILTEVRETITITTQTGAEDVVNRREETKQNCIPVNYSLGQELKKLGENFDASCDYTNVSDLTKMEATGEVEIKELDINNDNIGKTMNLTLRKREKVELTCEKKVASIKVTLADGNILLYKDVEKPENNIGTIISNPSITDPKQYLAVMDDEILHGATLEIRYKVTVGDQGAPFNGSYTVYDYIDEELSFKQDQNPDWEIVTDTNEIQNNILTREEDPTKKDELQKSLESKTVIKRTFDKDNKEVYLTVTKLLATNSTDEYENYAEIVEYSNDLGRRIYKTDDTGAIVQNPVPANIKLMEAYNNAIDWDILEMDEAKAEEVNIIPPFGSNNDAFIKLSKYIEEKMRNFRIK